MSRAVASSAAHNAARMLAVDPSIPTITGAGLSMVNSSNRLAEMKVRPQLQRRYWRRVPVMGS